MNTTRTATAAAARRAQQDRKFIEMAIRTDYALGESIARLARGYGLASTTIARIVEGI